VLDRVAARLGFHRLSLAVRRLLADATESARRLCAAARRPWRVAGFRRCSAALIFEIVRRWLSTADCAARGWLRWCPALPLLAMPRSWRRRSAARGALDAGDRRAAVGGLLQGNVAQEMKWRPERFADSLHSYYRLALENPAQLTVLPETALPAFLDQIPADYLDALQQLALRRQGDLLLGIRSPKAGTTSMRR
jgi:apolipoprotein N-acyltransferase